MSYGISLVRGDSTSVVSKITDEMLPKGGTYAAREPGSMVDESELYFNITYNFAWYFYETLDAEQGIRVIYGKKGRDVKPMVEGAIAKLGVLVERERSGGKVLSETWGKDKVYDEEESERDYWFPCAKNAVKALRGIASLCDIAPDFTFTGD